MPFLLGAIALSACIGQMGDLTSLRTSPSPQRDAGAVAADDAGLLDAGGPDSGAADAGQVTTFGGTDSGVDAGHDAGAAPPVVVGACNGLAAAGVWENISPPVGAVEGFAIAVDPVNQGTLYVGTVQKGFWKSIDCGASWVRTAGRNAANVNSGMNWTVAVDPVAPNVVYTNAGYGSPNSGLYKSTNGGGDWDLIWPPAAQPALAAAFTYNFANVIALDPMDHQHLLLTFHEQCLAPHPATCVAESFDSGASWRLLDGDPAWNGNEGQVIFFLENSATWLWGSQTNGFFRSSDSGAQWSEIPGMSTSHLQGSQLLRVHGFWYQAGADAVWRSATGLPGTWAKLNDTGPIVGGIVTDGVRIFVSTCYFPGFCSNGARYLVSDATDGLTWTELPSPRPAMGGTMAYDEGHHLLFSSNGAAGVWRMKTR